VNNEDVELKEAFWHNRVYVPVFVMGVWERLKYLYLHNHTRLKIEPGPA